MKKLIIRARIIFFTMIIISLFLTLYGVYKPMKLEIENNLLENFKLLSESKSDILISTIEKSLQGSRSLSSRTMIKNKIIEYKDNHIKFEDLQNFTEKKYTDGTKVLENLMYSRRIVDNKIVSEVCAEHCSNHMYSENPLRDSLSYSLFIRNQIISLEVNSPITNENEIIGYDILGFRLNDIVDSLNRDDIQFEISEKKDNINSIDSFEGLFEDEENVYYITHIYKENYILIHEPKNILFKSLHDIVRQSALHVVIGYVFMFFLVYIFIINFAKKQIMSLSENLDIYKTHADRDSLTGAYSRLYFNEFIDHYPYKSGFIVMIDLDNFKNINDKFGHIVGDSVLKTVVSVIQAYIKNDDLIIRYGGDEFILILGSKNYENTVYIVNEIRNALKEIHKFNFTIDFSYGISFVHDMKDAYTAIKEADEKMYECKRSKIKE